MALSEIIWMIMMMERRPNGMALSILHVRIYLNIAKSFDTIIGYQTCKVGNTDGIIKLAFDYEIVLLMDVYTLHIY